jgi:hypothetical protein
MCLGGVASHVWAKVTALPLGKKRQSAAPTRPRQTSDTAHDEAVLTQRGVDEGGVARSQAESAQVAADVLGG